MVQSLILPAGTSVNFSLQVRCSSTAHTGSACRVSVLRRNNRRVSIKAVVSEASPAVEKRSSTSLYDVLRVKENASVNEIKAAYRNLAKLYHPDTVSRLDESSDGRNFIEIHDAYVTLSDPVSRELYDVKLCIGSRRRGFGNFTDGICSNGSGFYSTRRWETDQCW